MLVCDVKPANRVKRSMGQKTKGEPEASSVEHRINWQHTVRYLLEPNVQPRAVEDRRTFIHRKLHSNAYSLFKNVALRGTKEST